jgi:hemerythrin
MPIVWTEQMRTGHPIIDSDHKALVQIINLVEQAVADHNIVRADQIIFALLAYVTGHFAREEAVQHQIDFPEREAHQQRHAIMADFSNQLDNRIREARTESQKLTYLSQLQDALGEWLLKHIMNEDMKMVPYLQQASNLGAW